MARPQSGLDRRIVEKARARFLIEGVEGASLRQIAKDAETNIGMVYYYFPTKDDLFLAVVEDVYEEFLAAMNALLAEDLPPEKRIEKLYVRVATMSEREFDVVRLIIREGLVSSSRLSKIAERFRAGHLPMVLGLILSGTSTERFRQDVPPVGILASMMANGIFPQLLRRLVIAADLPAKGLLPDAQTSARTMHEILMHGIAGPATRDQDAGGVSAADGDGARDESPGPSARRSASKSTPGSTESPKKTKKSR